MKTFEFVKVIFQKFTYEVTLNIALFICVSLMEMTSILSMAPLVDVFLHPDLQGVSGVTNKIIGVLKSIGIRPNLKNFIIVFLTFISLKSVFLLLSSYVLLRTKYKVLKDLISETLRSFFNAEWTFFGGTSKGTLLNTFNREMTIVGDSLSSIGALFSDIFRFSCFVLIPFYISWKVTITAILIGLVSATPLLLLGKLTYSLGGKNTSSANVFMDMIQECFGAAKVILGFGNQDENIKSVEAAFEIHRQISVKAQMLTRISFIYEPAAWGAVLLAVYLSFTYFAVPASELVIVVYSLLRLVPLIGNIVNHKNTLSNFTPSYEQIMKLIASAKRHVQKSGSIAFDQLQEVITFKGVTFSYSNDSPILKKIDITIRKGKMTAFVGKSGAGKSTLVDLLMGFYKPNEGTILVDGVPLFEHDIKSFRHKIGYVPQDSILFNASLRDNLLWSKDNVSDAEIIAACKLANAHDFIMEMPDTYETVVGDRGVRLSGGQRQRIALARAILRKPELLILDEATSALDSQSEALIRQAIENIAENTTTVVVAHRLSTITRADQIYVFEKGVIVESGTYAVLVSKGGEFFESAKVQGMV